MYILFLKWALRLLVPKGESSPLVHVAPISDKIKELFKINNFETKCRGGGRESKGVSIVIDL